MRRSATPGPSRAPRRLPPSQVASERPPARRGEALLTQLQDRLGNARLSAMERGGPGGPAELYILHLLQVTRGTGLDLRGYLPWNAPPSWSEWIAPYYRVLWAERQRDSPPAAPADGAPTGPVAPAAPGDPAGRVAPGDAAASAAGSAPAPGPLVQRLSAPGPAGALQDPEDWFAQTLAGAGPGRAPSEREQQLLLRIHGRRMEGLRIHEGGLARALAGAVSARAFTVGRDIYLPDGARPESPEGAELLAHESTHVLQAIEGRLPSEGAGLRVSEPSDPHEREAEQRGREARQSPSDPWGLLEAPVRDLGAEALVLQLQRSLPAADTEPPEALLDTLRAEAAALRSRRGLEGAPDADWLLDFARERAPYPRMAEALEETGRSEAAAAQPPGGELAISRALSQPIVGRATPEMMSIEDFIELVAREEARYPEEEQQQLGLMISRLRKIFYPGSGWDQYIIPGAADVERLPGEDPALAANQEVALPDGSAVDIGHVLAGLDAMNHPQMVDGPLTINISSSAAAATWVGDLGSAQAEIQMAFVDQGLQISEREVQDRINENASGQDMLGDIDAYVINQDIGDTEVGRVSELLRAYYLGQSAGESPSRERRYTRFAAAVGLTDWDGSRWSNEADWIDDNVDEVNDAAAMYLARHMSGLVRYPAALGMSVNDSARSLLRLFVDALRGRAAQEPPE